MFKTSDYYDLEAATQAISDKKMLMELRIQVEALKLLLDKKGIVSPNDIDACISYLKTQPEIQMLYGAIETAEKKINEYKSDPQKHLKDLFNAKLNGTIH